MLQRLLPPEAGGRASPSGTRHHEAVCHHEPWCLTAVPELLLALPSQIPHQPVGVEGVLGRHAPPHDGVQEGLALAGIEPENLQGAEVGRPQNDGTSEPHGCYES